VSTCAFPIPVTHRQAESAVWSTGFPHGAPGRGGEGHLPRHQGFLQGEGGRVSRLVIRAPLPGIGQG
jgi:hypothetical protein